MLGAIRHYTHTDTYGDRFTYAAYRARYINAATTTVP